MAMTTRVHRDNTSRRLHGMRVARVVTARCAPRRSRRGCGHEARRRGDARRRAREDDDATDAIPSSTLDALASVLARANAREDANEDDGRVVVDVAVSGDAPAVDDGVEARRTRRRTRRSADGWNAMWTPLSETYDVPFSRPFTSYALVVAHVVVFAYDLVMFRSGHGSGGDAFGRLALYDHAVVYESEWWRVFTSSLVDFGLLHFALVNVGLATVGAEAEALLGRRAFAAVYALSAAFGGMGSMALDSTTLHVTSSDGLFGVFGAMLMYSAMNVENEWNNRGFTTRLFQCAIFVIGLGSLTLYPTEDGSHVVNSVGHLWGFVAGGTMGYAGLAPLFTSGKKFSPPPKDGRKLLVDLHDGPRKTFALLGSLSSALAALSIIVIAKRFLDVDPRDVF